MRLKDTWVNKVDNVDDVTAKDINDIAENVISSQEEIDELKEDLKGIPIAHRIMEEFSLLDVGTYSNKTDMVSIYDSRIECGQSNICTIPIRGYVHIEFSTHGSYDKHYTVKVDGETIDVNVYKGIVAEKIEVDFSQTSGIKFDVLQREVGVVGGIISKEDYIRFCEAEEKINSHTKNTDNPHKVTAEQTGAGTVSGLLSVSDDGNGNVTISFGGETE